MELMESSGLRASTCRSTGRDSGEAGGEVLMGEAFSSMPSDLSSLSNEKHCLNNMNQSKQVIKSLKLLECCSLHIPFFLFLSFFFGFSSL